MPTTQVIVQLLVYLAILLALAWPLGKWLSAVADGRIPRWMAPFVWAENALYRLAGVDPARGTSWKSYAIATVAFNVLGIFVVYALQRLQGVLPLNPQSMVAVSPDSAFDTAVSFAHTIGKDGTPILKVNGVSRRRSKKQAREENEAERADYPEQRHDGIRRGKSYQPATKV